LGEQRIQNKVGQLAQNAVTNAAPKLSSMTRSRLTRRQVGLLLEQNEEAIHGPKKKTGKTMETTKD